MDFLSIYFMIIEDNTEAENICEIEVMCEYSAIQRIDK